MFPKTRWLYLYYLNVDFYRYFIGREDQSVNEKIMIGRIDQQLFVTKTMISMYELRMISSKKLRKYMVNYLAIMMTVSSILCIRSKKPENLTKKKELWSYLKRKDYKTYMKIRYGVIKLQYPFLYFSDSRSVVHSKLMLMCKN